MGFCRLIMPKKFSEKKEDSFFEKIPNLKAAFGLEEKEEVRLLDRVVLRIRKIFSFSDESSPSLKGRVEEMLPKINTIYYRLIGIKESVSSNHGNLDELKAFIDLILEPLIEQGLTLKEQRESTDPFHQVKILDLYQIWIEKAESWIASYQSNSREAFCRLVNEYIWKNFASKVEKDLKIIEDYIEHAVQALLLSDGEKKTIKVSILRSISHHVMGLANLKKLPKEITFKELEEWNRRIDSERQHHFEMVLALIDRQVDEAKPYPLIDEHQHLLDVITLINSIEEQTVVLKHRSDLFDSEPHELESIQQKARVLLQEAHKLSLDLRLSQAIVERLENIQTTLDELV